MVYWVFHEEQLARALAAFEARRQREGVTEQQAKDETELVAQFLASPEAHDNHLVGGRT